MLSSLTHKKFTWLGIVSIFSIVALLCFQGYWLYNGYRNTYDKFIDTAKAAFKEACEKENAIQKTVISRQINQISSTSIKSINIIKRDSLVSRTQLRLNRPTLPSVFMYSITDTKVNLERLDSLFRHTLAEKGLYIGFMLETTQMTDKSVQTFGEHTKSEVKIEAENIQLMSLMPDEAKADQKTMNISMNVSTEQISAYLQFTPLAIFRQMLWTLAASLLLFVVILYCLLSQLSVIRRQKTAARMKNDFIANFTHELKTPIAVVYAALDNIERNPAQAEAATEAGKTQLKRLSDSVEKILSLSVEEQNQIELHREETSMADWLASLIEPFRLKTEKDVTFKLVVDPHELKAVIDKTHFAHALNNIIDNAIKYSDNQVHIVIDCMRKGQGMRIAVADNGTGIAEENLKRIFDRFYRVKNSADKVKGFGLGLNYAKTIVELHGGTIGTESTLGKGSTFTIEI